MIWPNWLWHPYEYRNLTEIYDSFCLLWNRFVVKCTVSTISLFQMSTIGSMLCRRLHNDTETSSRLEWANAATISRSLEMPTVSVISLTFSWWSANIRSWTSVSLSSMVNIFGYLDVGNQRPRDRYFEGTLSYTVKRKLRVHLTDILTLATYEI